MLHLKTSCTRSLGWALFGVNHRPLQEIEATMGDGRIFDTGPFFARLRYYNPHIYSDTVNICNADSYACSVTSESKIIFPVERGHTKGNPIYVFPLHITAT